MSDVLIGVLVGGFAGFGVACFTIWKIIRFLLSSDMEVAHQWRKNYIDILVQREREITKENPLI